jgi:hypothetical protein
LFSENFVLEKHKIRILIVGFTLVTIKAFLNVCVASSPKHFCYLGQSVFVRMFGFTLQLRHKFEFTSKTLKLKSSFVEIVIYPETAICRKSCSCIVFKVDDSQSKQLFFISF